jgi:hypothetical protein
VGTCFQRLLKKLGKKYDARARLVCPQKVSRTIKEVAISCGWINEARAKRIF